MGMNPITPHLRSIHNAGNSVAKVSLVIPAGDELAVSDYVAGQLQRQGSFRDGAPATVEAEQVEPPPTSPTPRRSRANRSR